MRKKEPITEKSSYCDISDAYYGARDDEERYKIFYKVLMMLVDAKCKIHKLESKEDTKS